MSDSVSAPVRSVCLDNIGSVHLKRRRPLSLSRDAPNTVAMPYDSGVTALVVDLDAPTLVIANWGRKHLGEAKVVEVRQKQRWTNGWSGCAMHDARYDYVVGREGQRVGAWR